jgi:hypothetical protein
MGDVCVAVRSQQWADGLKKVLKLDIPFLEFQDILGLPKRDVAGGNTGMWSAPLLLLLCGLFVCC